MAEDLSAFNRMQFAYQSLTASTALSNLSGTAAGTLSCLKLGNMRKDDQHTSDD